jgi:hypothetical protein
VVLTITIAGVYSQSPFCLDSKINVTPYSITAVDNEPHDASSHTTEIKANPNIAVTILISSSTT